MSESSSHTSDHVLFQPLKIGRVELAHRTVMAPLTRYRADHKHVHNDLAVEYYSQRASFPGTLLISEATFISPQAGGQDYVPGIYTADQIAAWRRVTDAVHSKGSFMFLQLWALGRAATPTVLAREGLPFVAPSSKPLEGGDIPRALSVPEIQQYVRQYAQAARNAIAAGFDGVEIHAANGFLIDQFLQDVSNERTDEYGGGIERRSRFCLEVVEAVVNAVGQDRTGIRLSPWSVDRSMRMVDPVPQFTHLIASLKTHYPDFAYIHFVEPPLENGVFLSGSNDPFRDLWAPKPFLSANEHTPESAFRICEQKGDVIVFGRWFISNPDLPRRLKERIPFAPYDEETFYTPQTAVGYTDYPFAEKRA